MSDYYKDMGDFAKARQALETGLSNAPDAKGLRRRLSELDAEVAKRNKPGAKAPTKQEPTASQ
jgi:hypothetical protein